ncbi:MAG: carboxypeptidase-like regulatory domain-containing protein [Bacteroidia bacterium]|nr:carboxypeptidase-like regulatory domain-containing protein [Bacteroidia bacterium]
MSGVHIWGQTAETEDTLSATIWINLPQKSYETTDSLIRTIEHVGDLTISYSSRVLPYASRPIELKHKRWQLLELLNKIFGRYKVQYHVEDKKVIVSPLNGDKRYTISGYLKESGSKEALIAANVYDMILFRGAVSNEFGYYSLTLPEGNVPLKASFIGYTSKVMNIDLRGDTVVNIELARHDNFLDIDVDVVNFEPPADAGAGVVRIPIQQVKVMPSLMGESDIIRAMQHTPGIQGGEEGFGGMSVRGGNSDQNIVMLDNVPLYNPMHLMGLYTAFNAEGINSATLIKGGFPARYGGRMSSVLDIKMREGNMHKFNGYMNIGLLSSNVMFEGPIVEEKVSFIVSARRTYADIFSGYIQNNNDTRYSFYFYDISSKLNYVISNKDRIYVSFFVGSDNLNDDYNFRDKRIEYEDNIYRDIVVNDEQQYRWGSIISSMRWNRSYSGKLFCNTTASFSRYRFRNRDKKISDERGSREASTSTYFSGLNDYTVKTDVTYYPSLIDLSSVRAGIEGTLHAFYPGYTMIKSDIEKGDTIRAEKQHPLKRIEGHAYVESQLKLKKLSANIGLHLSMMNRKNKSIFVQLEPRALLTYAPKSELTIKVGGSCMSQFLQQMHVATVETPADMWLPVSNTLPPPRVWQVSLETEVKLTDRLKLTLEGYRKNYVRLQTYKTTSGVELLANGDWDKLLTSGEGWANGFEAMLHKTEGRISGWLAYSYSKSMNRYDELNKGKYFPTDYDKRHGLTLYGVYSYTPQVDFSALWTYHSGAPLTIPDGQYVLMTDIVDREGNQTIATLPGERNKYRMVASHSLTLGCNIRFDRPRGEHTLSFGVYNVYGMKNPMFVYWKPQTNKEGDIETYNLKQFSLIAFPLPYIKYSFKF